MTRPPTALHQSILEVIPKARLRDVCWKFLLYFPLCFSLVFGLIAFIVHVEYKRVSILMEKEQVNRLHLVKFIIHQDLETLASDLLVLAKNETLSNYLHDSSPENKSALATRFLQFVRDRKGYDQARYLDLEGNEAIRVNINNFPKLVKDSELQNKKDRYYFKDTLILEKDEIFVSPLDLNIEQGQVQRPFVPVLRVGTPVFDQHDSIRGMVLLNLKARSILHRYSDAYPQAAKEKYTIVNADGFWLHSEEADKEWGFMLGNNQTLKEDEPELWKSMKATNSGQLHLKNGLFTFETIYPARVILATSSGTLPTDQNNRIQTKQHNLAWHLLLQIPNDQLTYRHFVSQYPHLFWVAPLLFFVVVGAVFHLAIIRVRKINVDRSLTLLSTAIEQSPAAVVITAVDGAIQYANPKFEKMTGYERLEMIGANPRIFKSGKTDEEVYKTLWKTVLAGHVWKGDFENIRKDGTPYYVSAQIGPIFNIKGEINGLLAIQEDTTNSKLLQDQLKRMATTDGLTGILTRNHFLTLSQKEAQRFVRYGQPLTLLSFDLDFFKTINDTYGHYAGDQVLISFTNAVSAQLRESDLFGRLGGEEFSVLLVGTDDAGGAQLAERLRIIVEKMQIPVDGKLVQVTVSIGGAQWQSGDEKIEEVLKRADRSLYKAKHQGRNQVVFNFNNKS